MSFITGSLTGSFLKINPNSKKITYKAINLSAAMILDIPLFNNEGVAILNTRVFGTLITFCSLLQLLLADFKSK